MASGLNIFVGTKSDGGAYSSSNNGETWLQ